MTQQIDVVIIGGGQAGLAMSYYLTQEGANACSSRTGPHCRDMAEPMLGFVHACDAELDDQAPRLSLSRR